LTFSASYVIILPDMRDMTGTTKTERKLQYPEVVRRTTKKVLTCDMCDREDGAKSEWEGTIKVREWGNPYDWGTICDECQETVNDG